MAKTEKVTVHEIKPDLFINVLAEKLKQMKEFAMPEWAKFVKTSHGKERPPQQSDWWYIRAASILRTLYVRGVVGVERLRTKYGTRKNPGVSPEKFVKASGKIIRTILQQAEKAGLAELVKGKRSGRRLTKKGKEWLEEIAAELKKKEKNE